MRRLSTKILTILLLLCTVVFALAADAPKLYLQLDKSSYVSGETIRFKNTIANSDKERENVLFVDLCGEASLFTSVVVLRKNNHWEAQLEIPDSLQTGVYMVRAYTGNDAGTPTVVNQLITVFNRFGKNEQNEEKKTNGYYKPFYASAEGLMSKGGALKCSAEKASFKTDETIKFKLEKGTDNFVGGVSFDVVKVDTLSQKTQWIDVAAFSPSSEIKLFNGLTLRGKLIDKKTQQAVADEVVFFSVADSIPDINYALTDSTGEFRFTLENYFGEQTAIVQAQNKIEQYEIQLYPTFLLPPAKIPYYVPIEREESEFTQLSIKRALFTKAYHPEKQTVDPEVLGFRYPFYGISKSVVYPNVFVDLNDFEEIAKEILPLVGFKCAGNECTIKVYDSNSGIYYNSPWVMVDGVPISDLFSINKLNSLDINRVEVQPAIRCYGNLLMEGAVAVFTTKGNFDGIDLPKNAVKININTYFQPNAVGQDTELFFKDVLFWDAHLEDFTNSTQKEVKTSFETGNYAAIVQGVDDKGILHQAVFPFTIEPKK